MAAEQKRKIQWVISLFLALYFCGMPVQAQYGGGSGTAEDPYLIYTAEQLNEIGLHEDDWDKHFKLMAGIDIGAFTGTNFNIIGYFVYSDSVDSKPYTGVFDGNGKKISNFNYTSMDKDHVGLFGYVNGVIKDLGLIDPNIDAGTGNCVGSLVGRLRREGTITGCYVEGGTVKGDCSVGGLVGAHSMVSTSSGYEPPPFTISNCYSKAIVVGADSVGGLVGSNYNGLIYNCYATGPVSGNENIGGLAGYNFGTITNCYSTGNVSGNFCIGGLVGCNSYSVIHSYSSSAVTGNEKIGGLVGKNAGSVTNSYSTGAVSGDDNVGGLVGTGGGAIASFWDIETSGQLTSTGGKGRTTTQMQMAGTFFSWGGCENEGIWTIDEGKDYPRLWWENKPGEALDTQQLSDFLTGAGTKDDPYLIYTVEQINIIGVFPCDWDKHYKLMADIDLGALRGTDFNIIAISYDNAFTGVFDGNGRKISNFNYNSTDTDYIGLFGCVSGVNAEIKDLGLIDTNIDAGTGNCVGSLVGRLREGTITSCYIEGGTVKGDYNVGGLVGENYHGTITNCYSAGRVIGERNVGGLAGYNWGTYAKITTSYSIGAVSGNDNVGGLVGRGISDMVVNGFWDVETSGQTTSAGGTGKITAEMQMSITFYGWGGWDSAGNGLWTINEGNDYPRLWWENAPGDVIEPTQLPEHATSPNPPDGTIHRDTWIRLSWLPGGYAFSHRVYFGDNFDDVNDGTGGTFRGNRTSTSYVVGIPGSAYPYGLVPGTTYYWRIDEVNNIHPESPCKGDIWSFKVARKIAFNPSPPDGAIYEDTWVGLGWSPGDYAVSHDVYFGDNFDDVNEGIESTFQGNQADTSFVVGFEGFSYPDGLVPGTTYYWRVDDIEADGTTMHKGDVWSFWIPPKTAYAPEPAHGAERINPSAKLGWTAGLGAKLHAVYFGDDFDTVNNAAGNLPQVSTTYDPGPLRLAKTYYWRVDELDGVFTHKGDVWSFTTQGGVANPNPADGAVNVKQTKVMTWSPSIYAASHQLYFGTDKDAVKNADTGSPEYKGSRNLGDESYDPGMLEWDTTYYWRIDEVNSVNPYSPWIGPVWSFTTANFIVVDDFESYNDLDPDDPESNRIWNAWLDGYEIPANGSLIGTFNWTSWRTETVVHGGAQSMWYYYDNSVGKSEATITLIYPRDWTEEEVGVLSLWFYGDAYNAPEPMYVALSNYNGLTALVYHDNPDAALIEAWTEWRIGLQAFADQGVNLAIVNTMSLGFGNRTNPIAGGSGELWFDDIRLYRSIPEL